MRLIKRRMRAQPTMTILQIFSQAIIFSWVRKYCFAQSSSQEVEKRILDRLRSYLEGPVSANILMDNFRANGAFSNDLEASDRDKYLILAYSLQQPLIYYGLEDGTCPGYYWNHGYYREPGNSGYSVDNPGEMGKHLKSCVDSENGEPIDCLLAPGSNYISCKDELGGKSGLCDQIDVCPNQPNCEERSSIDDRKKCYVNLKWCRQYTIEKATVKNTTDTKAETTGLGYVPITNFCHNQYGHFSQEINGILDPAKLKRESNNRITDSFILTNCTYGNGVTLVNRRLAGRYAACGNNNEVCDTVFSGGYASSEYDPRYRPWYMRTKRLQKSNWQPPYLFFDLALGITYATPIYKTITIETESNSFEKKQIFAGVLAVDYRLEDIAQFLIDSYGNSSSAVIVYEDAEPNYLIGSSTGSDSYKFVLKNSNGTKPCPIDHGDANIRNSPNCTAIRISAGKLQGDPMDTVLINAFHQQLNAGYPKKVLGIKESLVSLRDDDKNKHPIYGQAYTSRSTLFKQEDAKLAWRVIIVTPAVSSTNDSITLNSSPTLFLVVCLVGISGILSCTIFLVVIHRKRTERAFVYSDWRFTSCFMLGCILLNISTLTRLGENTNTTCLLRMWMFHLFFVMALAPLFVKVWRIYQLVGREKVKRKTISNRQAALYTLHIILSQIVILLIFTILDPPKETEILESDEKSGQEEGIMVQRIVCESNTAALRMSQLLFEASFVVVGCILAYKTRNLKDDFSESKQLIFAMYNIALVGVICLATSTFSDMDGSNGNNILQAIGVFWGTTLSATGFVLPRLYQVKRETRERDSSNGRRRSSIRISGINISSDVINEIDEIESNNHHVDTTVSKKDEYRVRYHNLCYCSNDSECSPLEQSTGEDSPLEQSAEGEQDVLNH